MTKKRSITYFQPKGTAGTGEHARVKKAGKQIKIHDSVTRQDKARKAVSRQALRRVYQRAAAADHVPPSPEAKRKRRVFGAYKGKFTVGPEFFEPLSREELKAWGEP
jgi:hypothetical protein